MTTATASPLTCDQLASYRDQGFCVVRSLIEPARIAPMIAHYMALRAAGPRPGDMGGDPRNAADPLNRFPRFINQHQWDADSAAWCRDPAIAAVAAAAMGQGAVLNQSMLYFKPPGARGQALHQDQQYITIDPLVGVWVALDRADRANGGMVVVPGSHRDGIRPVRRADESVSFVGGGTAVPAGMHEVGIDLDPGDGLVFCGGLIHGSHPNTTADRFRRSFICHFVGSEATIFEPVRGTHMRHLAP